MINERYSELIAMLILAGFADYRKQFQEVTAQAQLRFETANWNEVQLAAAQRIDLYEVAATRVADEVRAVAGELIQDHHLWIQNRSKYSLIAGKRNDAELAETFYNSVYCRLLEHLKITNQHMYIRSALEGRSVECSERLYRTYMIDQGLVNALKQMLNDFKFNIPWENWRRDLRNLVHYIRSQISDEIVLARGTKIEVIRTVFFRNKAAYIVGRVKLEQQAIPFVLPVLNNEKGAVYIDTAISQENDVSIIFSFTRAYFMVDIEVPSEFVSFLHSLIPMKSKAELYNSIGFYKQGKAEFYRNFIDHLKASDDQFEITAGTKGMVMTVFTLPSYPVVFKIIKDRFASSKQITRPVVIEKYQLVKRHDRAGRMADTQEFINLALPRERFSDALLQELQSVASSTILITDSEVTIKHLWTERRMVPLNIYLTEALERQDGEAIFHAMNEFGKCIKELAAANIFAGDMLFKNFGVTRHGRVVFYDYDEIQYLSECNFRQIPEPLYPEQELASEPWYSVAANDVFPEEFTILTACDRQIRKLFNELHGELLDYRWWQTMQKEVKAGAIVDLFPYRKLKRFPRN